jgi:sugar lactone lactonase YvrE
MESSSLARIVRRLPLVLLPVLPDRTRASYGERRSRASAAYISLGIALIATLLLAGCGSSNNINSVSATVNQLSNSRGLAVDSSRNIYIADAGNQEIALVTNSTGLLTVFAGTGLPGFSPDGSAATSAQMRSPQGVAVDSSGNLYIADTGNNCIRKITASSGTISTIAGVSVPSTGCTPGYAGDNGLATSAELKGPQAVALDSSGNLYIADTGNNVIRKVVLSTGVITTVAGNGTAGFSGDGVATSVMLNTPADVKVDSSGNLFIADQSNFAIREVSASTGAITTVAGLCTTTPSLSCSSGYTGDGGAATSAQLNSPQAVAVDSSGNIYIADTGNNVVRKVSGGTITTAVGNGTAGYTGDGGSPGGAELNFPDGLTFDTSGMLYIDDAGNKVVRTVKF